VVLHSRRLVGFVVLVVLVVAAVFFVVQNWRRVGAGAPAGATLVSVGTVLRSAPPAGPASSAAGYFAAARLQRDTTESRELSELQALAAAGGTAPAVRAEAQEQILQLEQMQAEESTAELVLQAKGYPQALVLLRPGGATVVVQATTFNAASAALVAQAVAGVAGLDPAQVQIVTRGS